MNVRVQDVNQYSSGGKIKQKLLGILGVLVVLPSLINAGTDIWRSIMNSPVGGSEVRNSKLMKAHWEEDALFKKDIEITKGSVTTLLKIRVYENADVFVKYGSQEQWFASSDATNRYGFEPTLIRSAVAQESIKLESLKQSLPVLKEESEPLTFDLDKIRSKKEESLSKDVRVIERSYLLVETNDTHGNLKPTTKTITKSFEANKGYVFVDAKLDILSMKNSSVPKLKISNDKKTVTVEVDLKSGPFYDRWKGWIKANVITKQQAVK